ncbi:BQ2448_6170 [Microbotryum intermedium]|uniref:BQ2448_6170 protein n=1 Tax=Microbotryum intermedium TaxID=269621 RepID=A0A238FIX3_9BASI|nr:BQ2448_6170 [Microbotryum intermedium]
MRFTSSLLSTVAAAALASAAPVRRYDEQSFLSCLASNSSLNLVSWALWPHRKCCSGNSSSRASVISPIFYSSTSSPPAAFNQRLFSSASAVVSPTDAEAVAAAVDCARNSNKPVTARGGGHSYAAYGVGNGNDQGLVVYLSNFQSIQLKEDNRTVVVRGGAHLGDIAVQLNKWGLGMAHGVCPFVGVGGHAAFGGFGYASRAWGLTLDSITAFDVVLANGTYIQGLTREQDPDLFWALSGAAPNYGIVTAYHFLAHKKPENAVRFKYGYSGASADTMTQAFLAYQKWGKESLPSNLGITYAIHPGGMLEISGVYYGTGEAFTQLMAPFEASLPSGVSTSINCTMSWIDSLQALAGSQALSTQGQNDYVSNSFYAKSLMTPDSDQLITEDAAKAYFTYLQHTETNTKWFLEVNLYGGAGSAINAVPLTQSSFAHRSMLLTFQMYASSSTYSNPYPDQGFSFVSGMYDALVNPMKQAWGTSYGSYVNYVKTLYWGSQYERLSALRAKYDPTQVFTNPQAIQPVEQARVSKQQAF